MIDRVWRTERSVFAVAFGVLAILGVLAIVWYRQRMLFVDPAYITFEIIQYRGFMISEKRYGSFITQMWPLITSLWGLPLKTVLITYSFSFYLFYLIVAALVGWRWKQYALGTLMVLYFTLIVSDVYFWPNNEIHQAVGWMMLFLGLYFHAYGRPLRWYEHILLVSFAFLATVTHMLVAAPIVFIWVYFHLSRMDSLDDLRRPRVIGYSLVVLGGIVLRYVLSQYSWYDNVKLGAVSNISIARVLRTFSSGQAESMGGYVLTNYWLIFPILALGVYATVRAGRWWLSLLTGLALLAYFILVCMTYSEPFGRDLLFYFESEWMAGGMVLAVPFVVHFLPRLRWKVAVGVMVVVFGIRLVYIGEGYRYFNRRLDNLTLLNEELKRLPDGKAALIPADALDDYFGMHWGVPVETLFLSELNQDSTSVTMKIDRKAEVDTVSTGLYSGNFRNLRMSGMNPYYYRLSPGRYRRLSPQQIEEIRGKLEPLPN